MANYGSLPGYQPAMPFSSLIGGVEAGQQMQYGALKSRVMQDEMQRRQDEKAALKTYASSGDDRDLLAAAPDTWMKLNESQRRDAEGAMKEFKEYAPFLTPENYGSWREGFQKKYKSFNPAILPPSEQMQTPEAVKGFVSRASALTTELDTQRTRALLAEQTAAKKKEYETIRAPALQLEQKFKERFLGLQTQAHLTVQENQQAFQKAENKQKLDMEDKLKEAKTTELREQHFYNNLRAEESALNVQLIKSLEKIRESYPGVEGDQKELELRRAHDSVNKKIQGKYKTWADKYKIPFEVTADKEPATQYTLPSKDDPNKMIPATKEQYNAWHGIK